MPEHIFNKITEELIDPEKLIQSESEFAKAIGRAYINYCAKLIETNRIDFAHQQKVFLEIAPRFRG